MTAWRLIPLLTAAGPVQMALDRWLLEQHELGLHPPTLRFYTWSPWAISLGYHQRHYPAHWQTLTWQGQAIDLVHRPSGGRAVLHQGDLTYAVITSGLGQQRLQAYQQICQFLRQGWQSLGVSLSYGEAGRGYIHNPDCFGTATGADLVMPDGAKLIGSAQLRRGQAILQHGSMRLQPEAALFAQVFGSTVGQLPNWGQTGAPSIATLMTVLTAAAQHCFSMELVVQPLTTAEWTAVLAQIEPAPSPIMLTSARCDRLQLGQDDAPKM
jgi:lipoate---protein ligase